MEENLEFKGGSLDLMEVFCEQLSKASEPDFEPLFLQIQEFIVGANELRIRASPESFVRMCHLLMQNLIRQKTPVRGIIPLSCAITKLRASETHLTSIHADLCQLCLMAKCFKPVLHFLDADITDIGQEGGSFDTTQVLLYYFYGGMIYTSLKKFERALHFFEAVVTTPAVALSHIMLEAYKKYILVSLLVYGDMQKLPNYTSHVVGHDIRPLCQIYHDLVTAYTSYKPAWVQRIVVERQSTFDRDKNMGLVKQVAASVYKRAMQRLTKTFMTLSLTDVANLVQLSGPKEVEKKIVEMIEDGEIFASINQKNGMVIFHDNPEKYDSQQMLNVLEKEVSKCTQISMIVHDMEEDISLNSLYVKKTISTADEEVCAGPSDMGTKSPTDSV